MISTLEVSVLVVDDQAPFRLAARAVLRRAEGFSLVGEAGTGEEALERVGELHPALVLMDINMPGMGGIEATRRIREAFPDTVVFLCSTYAREDIPDDAVSTRCPRGVRTASRSRRLVGWSSTASTVTEFTAALPGRPPVVARRGTRRG